MMQDDAETNNNGTAEKNNKELELGLVANKSLDGYGIRASKTRHAISKTAEHVVTNIRHLLIKECLEVAPEHGSNIRTLTKAFKNQTLAEIENEMDLLFVEENVVERFNKLDKIEKEQRNKRSCWRPTGVPAEDVAAHHMKVLEDHENNLKELLKREADKIEILKKEVLKLRRAAESTSQTFSESRSQTNKSLDALAKNCT